MKTKHLLVLLALLAASVTLVAVPASAAPARSGGAAEAARDVSTAAAPRVIRKVFEATSQDAGVAGDRVLRLKAAYERNRPAKCVSPFEHTVSNPSITSSNGGRTWKAVGTYDCTDESRHARGCDTARIAPAMRNSRNGVTLTFSNALGASIRYCWNPQGVWVTNFTAIGRRATFFEPTGRTMESQNPGGDRDGAFYQWAQRMTPAAGFLETRDASVYGFSVSYIDLDVQLVVRVAGVRPDNGVCVHAYVRHQGRQAGTIKESGYCA